MTHPYILIIKATDTLTDTLTDTPKPLCIEGLRGATDTPSDTPSDTLTHARAHIRMIIFISCLNI